MKPLLAAALFVTLAATIARAQTAPVPPVSIYDRQHVPLLADWRFLKADAPNAQAPDFNDAAWEKISIPHTWNALDGQDGGSNYYKGIGWYRRHLTVTDAMKGKSLYLRFEAINRKADIYVNGTLLGSHAGGNSAICLDATKLLKPGDNVIAVKANNRVDQDMPPLQADFTFFGGIYRPAELIAVNPFHISLSDFASPGVYASTTAVKDAEVTVKVRAIVKNDSVLAQSAPHFLGITIFDAKGGVTASQTLGLTTSLVGAGPLQPLESDGTREVEVDVKVRAPHLWMGRLDPYLYTLRASLFTDISNAPRELDAVAFPLGIRTFAIDPQKGFLLNGQPYDLRGVNRHQDRPDKGWAISEADHLQDMALIKEMGCTAVRLAHYQHSQFFYDLCDKEGIIAWAEVPVVDKLGNTNSDFTKNAQQQYVELIRQNFNHPSIAFWSAGNEVDPDGGNFNRNGPAVYPWFKEMSALGHKEDPSRLTASAWREKYFPPEGTTDVIGLNEYLGWYTGGGPGNNSGWEGLETYIANHTDPAKGGLKTWAVTEYGAGSSIYFHNEKPVRQDHSEEYQALLHEKTWEVFARHPEIWGKFVWNMFDFAVDNRAEGDHAGRNDKGLVTYDRQTRKDAFYFYKAVWSQEPSLWISSKRFTTRGLEKIPVKVYTNAPNASLTLNGTALGEKKASNGTILWDAVTLKPGENKVTVSATTPDGKPLTDTATWTYAPGAPAEVRQPQDDRMRQALQPQPARGR
jgi:beta-galactosidase